MMIVLLQTIGEQGIPFQYLPRTDDFIALILLVCFFISSFVLSRNKRHLLLQIKSFFNQRDRASIFGNSASIDIRFLILMLLQTAIFSGLFFFNFFDDISPSLMENVSPYLLLGGCQKVISVVCHLTTIAHTSDRKGVVSGKSASVWSWSGEVIDPGQACVPSADVMRG